jgi:hypothetical protein
MNSDRARWNDKYRGDHVPRSVNPRLQRLARLLKPGRVLDLAGGMGQNARWVSEQSTHWRVVIADISDTALHRASPHLARILCDASALPFAPHSFDTILCTRFFDARVHFAEWLARDGTVFFETFTTADAKYYPDFNPAHRFDLATVPRIFGDLEILHLQETDDGHRVFVTIVAHSQ